MIPPNPHPWLSLEHEGERYIVRFVDGVCWIVRKSEPGAIFIFDPDTTAPAWARGEHSQGDLFT